MNSFHIATNLIHRLTILYLHCSAVSVKYQHKPRTAYMFLSYSCFAIIETEGEEHHKIEKTKWNEMKCCERARVIFSLAIRGVTFAIFEDWKSKAKYLHNAHDHIIFKFKYPGRIEIGSVSYHLRNARYRVF